MRFNRRTFLKHSTTIASGVALGARFVPVTPALGMNHGSRLPLVIDPDWHPLIQHGLDTARSAGASYADIRLTHTHDRLIRSTGVLNDAESIHAGVRALAQGYWGFASGPICTREELTRLSREAVAQAKTNALGKTRVADLAPVPVVTNGQWTMPVKIDPFDIHPMEVLDLAQGMIVYARHLSEFVGLSLVIVFMRQDKAFGSTDGSRFTQRVYRSAGYGTINYRPTRNEPAASRAWELLTPSGIGWEMFTPDTLRLDMERVVEALKEDYTLPVRPVDVGRYPMLLGAAAIAPILSTTIGAATELDRALGYEANAEGTSYLNAPDEMLGTFKIGRPLLSVSANRTAPGATATVRWDDDGVTPEPSQLVKDGILVNFQTTRESATWLEDRRRQAGSSPVSNGCAHASAAVDAPLARTANLEMAPGPVSARIPDLLSDMKKGVFFSTLDVNMDFQQLNGFATGMCYDIVNGKKTARLIGAGILFRAPELWQSLTAVGGSESRSRFGLSSPKGQPAQQAFHSVTAVPALFENATVIDIRRKA